MVDRKIKEIINTPGASECDIHNSFVRLAKLEDDVGENHPSFNFIYGVKDKIDTLANVMFHPQGKIEAYKTVLKGGDLNRSQTKFVNQQMQESAREIKGMIQFAEALEGLAKEIYDFSYKPKNSLDKRTLHKSFPY